MRHQFQFPNERSDIAIDQRAVAGFGIERAVVALLRTKWNVRIQMANFGLLKHGRSHHRTILAKRRAILPASIGISVFWISPVLSLIHISEPTRQAEISYAVF